MMQNAQRRRQTLLATSWLLLACITTTARGHEFWIEPLRFELPAGRSLQAHLNVGQHLRGNRQLYLPAQFEHFELRYGDSIRPVESRVGDLPAVDEPTSAAGLHVLSYVSTDKVLTYEEPGKFGRFLQDEGVEWVAAAHRRRGLPETGFREAYQRFAKALVKVGHGRGEDRPLGLAFELVLETNPYTAPPGLLTARLLWQGRGFPDARVNLFRRHDGEVRKEALTTDAEGRISIDAAAGPGIYLLNAVHMIEPPTDDDGVVWKSLWASTTFAVAD